MYKIRSEAVKRKVCFDLYCSLYDLNTFEGTLRYDPVHVMEKETVHGKIKFMEKGNVKK